MTASASIFYSSHGQKESTPVVKNTVFLVLGAKSFIDKQFLEQINIENVYLHCTVINAFCS